MKTKPHAMHAAECEVCHGEGPLARSEDGAMLLARALGWAEEHGVTRCKPCRDEHGAKRAKA